MSLDKRIACFVPSKANSWRLECISCNRNEPFINTSEATKKVERPTRERLMYKCHEQYFELGKPVSKATRKVERPTRERRPNRERLMYKCHEP